MADAIYTRVRVRLLGVKATIVFDVLKCLGWKASIASEIVESTGTVNQLLLRKRDVLSSGLGICCLKCSSSAARISIHGIFNFLFVEQSFSLFLPFFRKHSTK